MCLLSDALLQYLSSFLGFSYLGRGVSSWLLQQSVATAPYLDRGVSPHRRPSWPSTWDSSSRPSYAHAATAPWMWVWSSWPPPLASGMGVWGSSSGPPFWPWTWGIFSRQPPLTSDLGSSSWPFLCPSSLALSAAASDLRREVTPLGRCPSGQESSQLLPLTSDLG